VLTRVLWHDKSPFPSEAEQPDVIKELQKIKVIETKNGSKLMVPLTKKQKDILKIFNIEEDDFLKSIFKKK
jgi:hypothetical protein